MSFRVSALVSAAAVLGLGSVTPASAQPQAPMRPRNSAFGSIFTPGLQQQQQQQLLFGNQGGFGVPNAPGFVGPGGLNPAFLNGGGGLGFGYPGQLAYPQVLPGAIAVNPQLPPSGIVGTFGNYGHWYNQRGGNYGHWYPNGIANGRGILGGGSYGGYGGSAGTTTGGLRTGNTLGTLGGTALGVGAAANQFRR